MRCIFGSCDLAHSMGAKEADALAIRIKALSSAVAGRSTGFRQLVHGIGLGWLFDATAATRGGQGREPLFGSARMVPD